MLSSEVRLPVVHGGGENKPGSRLNLKVRNFTDQDVATQELVKVVSTDVLGFFNNLGVEQVKAHFTPIFFSLEGNDCTYLF